MAAPKEQPIHLYIDYISQPARAVLALCKFNNIPIEIHEVRVFKGDQFSDEFTKINELKKVPAIVEGDFKLSESHAILRYLCNSKNVSSNWYPRNDAKKRAIIDRYLDWHHANTRRCTDLIVVTKFPTDQYVVQKGLTEAAEKKGVAYVLKTIEGVFLKDNKYLCGDEMTIADLSAFCELTQLRMINYDFSGYAVLSKWLERMLADPVIQDVHKVLFKILSRSGKPNL